MMLKSSSPKRVFSTLAAVFFFAASLQGIAQAQGGTQQRGMGLAPAAGAERRVALVMGNSNYATAPLKNPVNDANLVATTLREIGFDVISKTDADLRGMQLAIREFSRKIQNGAVGLFYYAGHGMQSGGRNFLIPIGAQIETEGDLVLEGLDLNSVLEQMGTAQNRLNIVILDACRNNPFTRSFRSYTQGLAQVNAPAGTFIAYATAPGQTASDGKGQNGLYTQELIANLRAPGMPIEEVFKRVRVEVKAKSSGLQIPWDASSLEGSFSFVPGTATAATASAPPPVAYQPVYPPAQPVAPPVSPPARSLVSIDLIESNFKSNLFDEVIKDGDSFLASEPNNGKVNLRVGQSYFRKNMYAAAAPYLERALIGGESIYLAVKRHRKSLGIYDDLENGIIGVAPNGLQMQYGGGSDVLLMPFASIERLEAQPDPVRGMLIYLKGSVTNKKGKVEKKDYKLFAPNAAIVQRQDSYGNLIPVAVCQGCESWTTEVVKFINRSKSLPARTN